MRASAMRNAAGATENEPCQVGLCNRALHSRPTSSPTVMPSRVPACNGQNRANGQDPRANDTCSKMPLTLLLCVWHRVPQGRKPVSYSAAERSSQAEQLLSAYTRVVPKSGGSRNQQAPDESKVALHMAREACAKADSKAKRRKRKDTTILESRSALLPKRRRERRANCAVCLQCTPLETPHRRRPTESCPRTQAHPP